MKKLLALLLLFVVTAAFAQDVPPPVNEESVISLLKAMVVQVVNSPASLLVIIGLVIIAVVFEVVEWLPSKVILPLCVFGGACTYWIFSPASTVPQHFPHPQAVLVVNGLICGVVAFVIHITAARWMISKLPQKQTKEKDPNEK